MIRAVRPQAMAQDDASLISGWNISPNLAYTLQLNPASSACGVLLCNEDQSAIIASGAGLVGTDQPVILHPYSGQAIGMVDADLGWHLLLTTDGTEYPRTITIGPAVDLPDEIHPVYGDDAMGLVRATAAIDGAAHYRDDVTVSCPLGLGAGLGDVVSVPVDGAATVGQVESVTWTATPDGTSEQAVIRRHVAIAPEAFVEPVPITPPTVADDAGTTDAATTTSGNVLTNDEAGITVVAVNGLSSNVGVAVEGSNGGSFTIAADGAWSFDPDGDFAALEGSETADTSVTYYASDGVSEAMATLTVTVSAIAGGALWTPAEISGAIVFDALDSDNITLSGSAVTAWADMIGSGITAAQATASLQPAMSSDEIVFAGDLLTIAGSDTEAWCKALHSTGGWIFALVQYGTTLDPNAVYGLCGTNRSSGSQIGMSMYYDDRAGVYSSPNDTQSFSITNGSTRSAAYTNGVNSFSPEYKDTVTANTYHIVDAILDPANSTFAQRFRLSVDGGLDVAANKETGGVTTANAASPMQIGACGNNALPMVGKLKCIAFFPAIPTSDERQKMQGWAAHRHNKTALLPSGHPYKSAPPTL
jgi:VCBS repeat-containing protein